ncbi:hypothetical protein RHSIM_Rhsim07G0133600 [Rhododendron simsii]|uniref:Cytochrome P450 n=1 Tax=Rhododendron simsii TaxID=118357 RepID=A0A834LKI8_RHOSS|nr:hypothetical protein RHSIM_Rhsim07G0133600 [Rhododendron simsii]
MRMLKNLLQERQANPREKQSDFFDYVLEELGEEDTILTEEMAQDLMFKLLFVSFETTFLAITMTTKFLLENPLALKELTFMNETVRMANIAPGIFRKTLGEINFLGYTIPADWFVMVCPPAVHMNPAKYKDPLEFNPRRWEEMELTGASKHFMAFGCGMRFCLGTDFAKVQMAVFLHCLVTKYR